jgi:hypothetical protein
MALRYCPNGECVNFQLEMETNVKRCPMCAWHLVAIEQKKDVAREGSGKAQAA